MICRNCKHKEGHKLEECRLQPVPQYADGLFKGFHYLDINDSNFDVDWCDFYESEPPKYNQFEEANK